MQASVAREEFFPLAGPLPSTVRLCAGDLFRSPAETICVTVNCVGVMGKGVALQAKERDPALFRQYQQLCQSKQMQLGRPVFVRRLVPPSYLLFPTKDHWRSVSKLADIEEGLSYLAAHCREWGITSLAVPPLGCGNGGLEWAVVGPALYRGLSKLEIPVYVYVPSGVRPDAAELEHLHELATDADVERASATTPVGVVALVAAVARTLALNPGKEFGRILMQKLGYFGVAAGIPAPIHYERRTYGPYSSDWMRQVMHLLNNGLLVEERAGHHDAFTYRPGPSFQDYAATTSGSLESMRPRIERVARLMARMNAEQAELAATTHMVAVELARNDPSVSDAAVVSGVAAWKRRRAKPFNTERIATCLAWLKSEGWLPSAKGTGSTNGPTHPSSGTISTDRVD